MLVGAAIASPTVVPTATMATLCQNVCRVNPAISGNGSTATATTATYTLHRVCVTGSWVTDHTALLRLAPCRTCRPELEPTACSCFHAAHANFEEHGCAEGLHGSAHATNWGRLWKYDQHVTMAIT
jgi:hypothetical protein